MTSAPSIILCPACAKANEPDSRFCRYCGASLVGAVAAPTAPKEGEANGHAETHAHAHPEAHGHAEHHIIEAHSHPVTPLPVAPHPQADISNGMDGEEKTTPAEIDARRARQLLDRSVYLSERSDAAGAILACRQSIALAPTKAAGYSMLGLLLERTGDLPHAATAYEKAVQLSPNSTIERESLDRLREKLQVQKGAGEFHFDDAELYGDDEATKPIEKPSAQSAPVIESAAFEAAIATADEEPLRNISAAAPGLPADFGRTSPAPSDKPKSAAANPSLVQSIAAQLPALAQTPVVTERRKADRRDHAVPVMTERRLNAERRAKPVVAAGLPKATVAPIFPANVPNPNGSRTWDQMWKQPSYYGRSLPLVGATVLCLGFLLWARGWAVARESAATALAAVPATTDPGSTFTPPGSGANGAVSNAGNGTAPPLAPVGSANPQTGGFPVSNNWAASNPQPAAAGLTGAAPTVSNPVAAPRIAAAPTTNATTRRTTTQRRSPSFPQIIPPATIPASAIRNGGGTANSTTNRSTGGDGGGSMGLPSPNVGSGVIQDPPTQISPSSGVPALNPAGQSGRGYVRITRGRIGTSALPNIPTAQAGDAERGAANASRGGQTDRAISGLSAAINADSSDAGYRYQQRAMLFLDRGDYSRAADDFQSAISAYGEQISRGDQVNAARAGQSAARRGLNLALAGRGR
jgi:tetratricopeptide (TPR) repeat protein